MPWWGALLVSFVAMVTLYVAVTLASAIRSAARGEALEAAVEAVTADPWNLGAIQALSFGVAIFVGLVAFQRGIPIRRALRLAPVPIPTLALAAVAGFALQFPLAEIGNLAQELFPIPMEDQLRQHRLVTPDSALEAIATILAVVVIAAGSEELLFRGLMLPALRESYGTAFALSVSAILFGLVHAHPVAIAYATVAGFVLGAVALRTASTWPPVVMHAAINSVPLVLPERVVSIPGFNTLGPDVYHLPVSILLGSGVVAAAALAGMAKLSD